MRRPLPGVFHHAELPDTLDLRSESLSLVVPPDCVVTDRTAAWVWVGERALPPGDHLRTPKPSDFAPPGRRLRNALTDSGERMLLDRDVVEVGGLLVTSPPRTACELVEELGRFRGYRASSGPLERVFRREWQRHRDRRRLTA